MASVRATKGRGVPDRGIKSGNHPGTSSKTSPTGTAAGFKKSQGDGMGGKSSGGSTGSVKEGGSRHSKSLSKY